MSQEVSFISRQRDNLSRSCPPTLFPGLDQRMFQEEKGNEGSILNLEILLHLFPHLTLIDLGASRTESSHCLL